MQKSKDAQIIELIIRNNSMCKKNQIDDRQNRISNPEILPCHEKMTGSV